MSLGMKIYELRKSKNLSQNELAEILDVSRQSISKWETDMAIPELEKLIALCDLFEISLDELVGRENAPDTVCFEKALFHEEAFTVSKIIGYILLAFSLIGILITLIFCNDTEITYILIPIFLSCIACSLVCLLVRKQRAYWCTWTLLAPIYILVSCVTILPFLIARLVMMLLYLLFFFFSANKAFERNLIFKKRYTRLGLCIGWGTFLLWTLLQILIPMGFLWNIAIVVASPLFDIIETIISYVWSLLLATYTVCYLKSSDESRTHHS